MQSYAPSRHRLFAIVTVILIFTGSALAQQDPPTRMFVFGDSISDPGNAWVATGTMAKAPFAPIPDFPYAMGGHHFSNGKTWVEQLAIRMQMSPSGQPTGMQPNQFGNYAFGGARARAAPHPAPTAEEQVVGFLMDFGGVAPADALYVLQFGGNDVYDALLDPDNAPAIAIQAATTITGVVNELYSAGARHFLVANAPNLGQVPAVMALGEPAITGATQLSQFLNFVLEYGFDLDPATHIPGLMDLEALPGITIDRFDMFGFVDEVAANPELYGIDDVFFPCLTFGVKSGAKCNNANERLFWDAIHPTKKGHEALADIAEASLTLD